MCGDKVIENYTLSNKGSYEKNARCEITRGLPDNIYKNNTLFFMSQSISLKIYLEGEEIYRYGYEKSIFNTSPGDFVHFIRLPEDAAGKEIMIHIDFPCGSPSLMIDKMNLADGNTVILKYAKNRLISFSICIFQFMIGVICIICEIVLFRRVYGNLCLKYAGIFIICLTIWSVTQVRIIPLILGKWIYNSSTAYLALSLISFPLTMIDVERFGIKNNKAVKLFIKMNYLWPIFALFLNVSRVWCYYESIIVTQIILSSSAIFFIACAIIYSKVIRNIMSRRLVLVAILFYFFQEY